LIDAGLTYFIAGIYGNDLDTVDLLARRVVPELTPAAVPGETTTSA